MAAGDNVPTPGRHPKKNTPVSKAEKVNFPRRLTEFPCPVKASPRISTISRNATFVPVSSSQSPSIPIKSSRRSRIDTTPSSHIHYNGHNGRGFLARWLWLSKAQRPLLQCLQASRSVESHPSAIDGKCPDAGAARGVVEVAQADIPWAAAERSTHSSPIPIITASIVALLVEMAFPLIGWCQYCVAEQSAPARNKIAQKKCLRLDRSWFRPRILIEAKLGFCHATPVRILALAALPAAAATIALADEPRCRQGSATTPGAATTAPPGCLRTRRRRACPLPLRPRRSPPILVPDPRLGRTLADAHGPPARPYHP